MSQLNLARVKEGLLELKKFKLRTPDVHPYERRIRRPANYLKDYLFDHVPLMSAPLLERLKKEHEKKTCFVDHWIGGIKRDLKDEIMAEKLPFMEGLVKSMVDQIDEHLADQIDEHYKENNGTQ